MPDPSPPLVSDADLNTVTPQLGTANDVVGAVGAARSVPTVVMPQPGEFPTVRLEEGPGVNGAISGPVSTLAGAATFEQSRRAWGRAQNRDDRVNAAAGMANGGLTAGSGVLNTIDGVRRIATPPAPPALLPGAGSRLPGAANAMATVAGAVETAQGTYNTVQGLRNWDNGGEVATQQVSDGATQVVHGGLSVAAGLSGNPVTAAAAAGFGAGTVMVNTADATARESGIYGVNNHARNTHRGVVRTPEAAQNRSASETAADIGVDVRNRTRGTLGETGSAIVGGLATIPAAIGTTTVALADAMSGGALTREDEGPNTITVQPGAADRARTTRTHRALGVHPRHSTPPAPQTPAQIAASGQTRVPEMAAGLPTALDQARRAGQTEPTVTVLPNERDRQRNQAVMNALGVTNTGPPVFDMTGR